MQLAKKQRLQYNVPIDNKFAKSLEGKENMETTETADKNAGGTGVPTSKMAPISKVKNTSNSHNKQTEKLQISCWPNILPTCQQT